MSTSFIIVSSVLVVLVTLSHHCVCANAYVYSSLDDLQGQLFKSTFYSGPTHPTFASAFALFPGKQYPWPNIFIGEPSDITTSNRIYLFDKSSWDGVYGSITSSKGGNSNKLWGEIVVSGPNLLMTSSRSTSNGLITIDILDSYSGAGLTNEVNFAPCIPGVQLTTFSYTYPNLAWSCGNASDGGNVSIQSVTRPDGENIVYGPNATITGSTSYGIPGFGCSVVTCSPTMVLVSTTNSQVFIFNPETQSIASSLSIDGSTSECVVVACSTDNLILAARSNHAYLYNYVNNSTQTYEAPNGYNITDVALSTTLAVVGSDDTGAIIAWNLTDRTYAGFIIESQGRAPLTLRVYETVIAAGYSKRNGSPDGSFWFMNITTLPTASYTIGSTSLTVTTAPSSSSPSSPSSSTTSFSTTSTPACASNLTSFSSTGFCKDGVWIVSGAVNNTGTAVVSPGESILINNSFSQSAIGVLDVSVSEQPDEPIVVINRTASLDGTLIIRVPSNSDPQTVIVIEANNITGKFDRIQIEGSKCRKYRATPTYGATTMSVIVAPGKNNCKNSKALAIGLAVGLAALILILIAALAVVVLFVKRRGFRPKSVNPRNASLL